MNMAFSIDLITWR